MKADEVVDALTKMLTDAMPYSKIYVTYSPNSGEIDIYCEWWTKGNRMVCRQMVPIFYFGNHHAIRKVAFSILSLYLHDPSDITNYEMACMHILNEEDDK